MLLDIKDNYLDMWYSITEELKKYLMNNPKIKSLIIGVSGGIDSALCCALAQPICSELHINLHGICIPIETNADELDRGLSICHEFCNIKESKNMDNLFKIISSNIIPYSSSIESIDEKIRMGNIKARMRMMYLFDMSHRYNGMVLSTDNLTEYLLGFWTLHGDVGNFGLIQNLWKTEVYGLSSFLVNRYKEINCTEKAKSLQDCINAVPTDGLGITESDLDQIGCDTYDKVDEILLQYIQKKNLSKIQNHPVIKRYLNSNFKRLDPFNVKRQDIFQKYDEKIRIINLIK